MGRFSTDAVGGYSSQDPYGSVVPPIYLSVVYEYVDHELGMAVLNDRGNYIRYGREENPTTRVLEEVLAKLENGEDALAFNSGMAAETTLFLWALKKDCKVIIPKEVYSATYKLLEELSIRVGFKLVRVWPSAEAIAEVVDKETTLVFVEVLTNPTNKVIDLNVLRDVLSDGNAVLVVDNTFATPVVVKPLEYGARFVLHSLTKYLAGHNDVIGGAVVGRSEDMKELWEWRRLLGTIQQPFEAYMTLRGLKTLEVRFERISNNAQAVAEFLSEHPRVEEVMYPGLTGNEYHNIAKKLFRKPLFGGVVSFKVRGGYNEAVRFVSKLKIVKRAPSLGGTESLAVLPIKAGSSFIEPEERVKLGITENLVRLSVGLEDVEDLINDISSALS